MIECVLQIICGWTVRTSVDKVGIVVFQFVYVYSTFKEKKKEGARLKRDGQEVCVCVHVIGRERVCVKRE